MGGVERCKIRMGSNTCAYFTVCLVQYCITVTSVTSYVDFDFGTTRQAGENFRQDFVFLCPGDAVSSLLRDVSSVRVLWPDVRL